MRLPLFIILCTCACGLNGNFASREIYLATFYTEPGRRYGNQARRTWQSSEHDGLLGSGSFPRPSAYASGMAATKVRANDNYQLNRSNEPYHPPRPYKVNFHLIIAANLVTACLVCCMTCPIILDYALNIFERNLNLLNFILAIPSGSTSFS